MATKKNLRPLFVPGKVRAWANEAGLDVGVRGRLPEEVVDRYFEHKGRKRWERGTEPSNRAASSR